MCGVAGYIGTRQLTQAAVGDCLALMGRRGPDASDYYHHQSGDRHVFLLHTRLSIIDLDARANQPFRLGSSILAHNGEIYNYLELRQELAARGYTATTGSDTEILLQVLLEYGWEGVSRCEGMWAFACYNEDTGSLLLSRDRFGEKPLYLYRDRTGLYFGSEIKFIALLLGQQLEVNYNHLCRYMVNGYKALYKTRECFFDGIEELSAGHVLTVDSAGREATHRYWSFSLKQDHGLSFADAAARTREALIESVRLRLRSDVPLAFCLSGGIDSNSLIAIARRVFDYDVHGFTIVNTDSRYEEQDMVDCAINDLGIRHTAIPVQTTDFLPRLRTLVRQHDAPVYTITYYAHWLLMQAIADSGYRVSVSGTAADELFSGYFDHHLLYLASIESDPALFQESLANWHRHIRPIVRNPFLQDPSAFVRDPGLRDHIYLNAETFSGFLSAPWQESFQEEDFDTELLRKRMLNELFHESVPVILHEDDLNAMYFSIENRSPFLDSKLLNCALEIPVRHLVRSGSAKAVLREAMRGLVADPILDNRRKVGFNAPIFSFLDTRDANVRDSLLDSSPIFDHVRRDRIETLLGKTSLPNSESKFLFYFLNAKVFLEEFAA